MIVMEDFGNNDEDKDEIGEFMERYQNSIYFVYDHSIFLDINIL